MRRIPITKTSKEQAASSPEDEMNRSASTDNLEAAGEQESPLQGDPSAENPEGNGGESNSLLQEKDTEIQKLQEQLKETQDQMLRAMADIENVRRRGRQDREEAAQYGNQSLLADLLPVIDNLERAVSAADKATVESLLEGVNLTLRQFMDTLRKHGVEPVEGAGQPFDAQLHEAIMRAEPSEEHPAGTVVDEIRKGYTLRGRLLRPSLVKVAQEE